MNDNQSIVSECRSSCEGQGDGAARVRIRLCCLHPSLHKGPVTEGKGRRGRWRQNDELAELVRSEL